MAGNPFFTGTPFFGFTAPGTATTSTPRTAVASTTLSTTTSSVVPFLETFGDTTSSSSVAGFLETFGSSTSSSSSSVVVSSTVTPSTSSKSSSRQSPTGTSSGSNTASSITADASSSNGLTRGQLAAAIAVPIIVVLLLALGLFLFCCVFRKRKQRSHASDNDEAKAAGAGVSGRSRGLKGKLFGSRVSEGPVASETASMQEKNVAGGYSERPPPYLSGTGTGAAVAGAGAAVAGAAAGGLALGTMAQRETDHPTVRQVQAQDATSPKPAAASSTISPASNKEILLTGTASATHLTHPLLRPSTATSEKSFNSSLYSETASVHSAKAQRVSSVFAQMSIRGSEDGGSSRGGDSPPPHPPLPTDAAAVVAAKGSRKGSGSSSEKGSEKGSEKDVKYPFLEQEPETPRKSQSGFKADDGDATPRPRDTEFFAGVAATAAAEKAILANNPNPKEDKPSSSSATNNNNNNNNNNDYNDSPTLPPFSLPPNQNHDPATIAALAAIHHHATPTPSRSPSTDYLRLAATQTGNSAITGVTASSVSGEGWATPRSQRSLAEIGNQDGRRSEMTLRSQSSGGEWFGDAREE